MHESPAVANALTTFFAKNASGAGQLQITGVAPDADTLEEEVFDPARVPAGVELSDDPVLRFRGHVCRLSADRRRAGR